MFDAADRRRRLSPRRANRRRRHVRRAARALLTGLVRRRLLVGVILSIVFAAGWAVWTCWRSEAFEIDEVRVSRCEHISKAEIMDLIHLPQRRNIFQVDLDAIRRRLEDHPWIARVYVRRGFPSRLVVRIEERVPVAVVHLDRLYYLDDQARIFKRVERGDPLDLPVITGLTPRYVLEETDIESLLARALGVIREAEREADSFGGLSEVRVDAVGGIELVTDRDALVVRLGTEEFSAKIEVLGRVLRMMGARSRQVARIDLGVDGRAVVSWITRDRSEG